MDRGIYKDFGYHPEKAPNVPVNQLYNLVDNGTDKLEMRKMVLSHLIAGDSDSAYFGVPDAVVEHLDHDEDKITKFCDDVAGHVNERFPDFIMKAFNCPVERNDSMVAEREVVSDKSFFLTKKRYIMHVINDEGKKVDKLKIMGVEIKKSNTSVIAKKHLMWLVNMILDGKSRDEVFYTIKNEMRDDYMNCDLMDKAPTTSVNTLTNAEKAYRMTGSYKGIAWQAKAAMMWNDNRTTADEKINAGMKVGCLSVNHPDYNKIAFPVDVGKLPEWYLMHSFDYETMWKAHKKTIDNYIKAMEWDQKSMKKKALARSGFTF